MKRAASLALAALVGLTTVGLGATTASAAPDTAGAGAARPVLKVMPLGDSITAGYQSSTGAGYRLPLWNLAAAQSRYTMDFVGSQSSPGVPDPDHEGHGGYMIDQIGAGVDGWIGAANPDVVLLHLGINDLDRGTDKAHASDRLSALVDRISADKPGVTVIFQGLIPTTPNLQSLIQDFNSKVQAMVPAKQAAGEKFRYVDAPALTSAEFADGLHPNDQGYARMGQVFYNALDKAFTDGVAVSAPVNHAGTESGGAGRVRWADWDGDGKADYIILGDDGSVHVYLNKGT
ncbi:SGNH/GDSL hydrolase family protein, partial [Kitasatospora kazusensis]|uniref:SGNH/GDSL hydrolase family protein n=1 Tax=Kitasatospora kazusensis TaxID=407974 RepID=UPI0031DE970B